MPLSLQVVEGRSHLKERRTDELMPSPCQSPSCRGIVLWSPLPDEAQLAEEPERYLCLLINAHLLFHAHVCTHMSTIPHSSVCML